MKSAGTVSFAWMLPTFAAAMNDIVRTLASEVRFDVGLPGQVELAAIGEQQVVEARGALRFRRPILELTSPL